MKRVLAWSWTGLLIGLAGCVQTRDHASTDVPAQKYQVKCAGGCLELKKHDDKDQAALSCKVEELLREERHAAAQAVVERHAEAAIELLRERDAKQTPTRAELEIARALDALLQHPAGDGWHDRCQGHGRGGIERAEATLREAQDLVRHHQWAKAVALVEKNQATLAPFPYHAIQTGLILEDAQRLLHNAPAASQVWQQTALLSVRLNPRLQIPDLWVQVAGLRPIGTPWPREAAAALAPRLPACLQNLPKDRSFAPEALVWFAIGNARLARGDASEALTAFKRADSHNAFSQWDDFLLLHQAKALLAMQQTPAATGLLTTLAEQPDSSPWRLPALALMGAGKLQDGHTQQAHAFLREAVETSAADYPWRADAEANLGLTLLMMHDEPAGLRWLHSAQQRFEAAHDREGLRQSLQNEASYLADKGNAEDANLMRRRMRDLEVLASLPKVPRAK